MTDSSGHAFRARAAIVGVAALAAFALLIALGTWQVQRLQWKEALLSTIQSRLDAEPVSIGDIEARVASGEDVDYWPVTVEGEFRHEGERHFFATHEGNSGYFVYTPFELDDGRFLLVNRGFVPFDRKDPATRPEGQVSGRQSVTGLARDRLAGKPSFIVPENEPEKNVFYWKDLAVMAGTSGIGEPEDYLPFFVDADDTANPGGLPVGGVTIVSLPNNHLQYAITWYGLAAALAGVCVAWFWRRRPERS
jgi:surfeit locus 1 family protein